MNLLVINIKCGLNTAAARRVVGVPSLLVALLFATFFATGTVAAELNKLAFGGCNHSHLPQPMWPVIDSHQPDVFLWTGDVVYPRDLDLVDMQKKYRQQLSVAAYRKFSNSTPVVGIWDDHDFGLNNGGKKNPVKLQAQKQFLDFMGEPPESVRRRQKGIYTSYVYGTKKRRVKLILLDTRYHRDQPGSGRADILGAEQWRWLENEIKNSQATVNIIVSGVSVLSTQIPFAEEWKDFKWAKKRLFHLIDKYQMPGVLFLTGDRHFSSHLTESVKGKPYHEFMSSGLTHYMNRKRVSQIFRRYYGSEYSYFGLNFSLLEFHWDTEPLQLTYQVFDTENKKQVKKSLSLIRGRWSE